MWPLDDQMQTFKTLSYRDKLRVGRTVTRGEAPGDPKMAAAAVELAESYQRQSWGHAGLMRWWPVILIVLTGGGAILDAVDGDQLGFALNATIALLSVSHFIYTPITRPANMARSLEASKRVAAFRYEADPRSDSSR